MIKNIIIDNSDNDDEEDLKNNIDNSFNHIADREKPKNNEEKEEQNVSNTTVEDNNTNNDLKEENKVDEPARIGWRGNRRDGTAEDL